MNKPIHTVTKIHDLQPTESMQTRHIDVPQHLRMKFNKDLAQWLAKIDPTNRLVFVESNISACVREVISDTEI